MVNKGLIFCVIFPNYQIKSKYSEPTQRLQCQTFLPLAIDAGPRNSSCLEHVEGMLMGRRRPPGGCTSTRTSGLAAPRPQRNEKKMLSETSVLGADAPLPSGQDTQRYCKEAPFSLIFPGCYMLFFLQASSAIHQCVPGFEVSTSVRSSEQTGEIVLYNVTSLQHELPHVFRCSLAVCCACTITLIIFWLTVVLNHQIKTNEEASQKMG